MREAWPGESRREFEKKSYDYLNLVLEHEQTAGGGLGQSLTSLQQFL